MLALVAGARDDVGVHDAAALGTVRDGRVTAPVIHVLAVDGRHAGRHGGQTLGFVAVGRFAPGRE